MQSKGHILAVADICYRLDINNCVHGARQICTIYNEWTDQNTGYRHSIIREVNGDKKNMT